MKKLFVLLVACVIATTASAQFVNSGNVKSGSSSNAIFSATDDYNRIYFGYNPTSIKWEDHQMDLEALIPLKSSLTLGYLHASNLSKKLPLFIEYGANLQYSFGKNSRAEEDYSESAKVNMFSVNIPINLAFKFQFNDCALTPYVGLNLRVNMSGKYKYEYEFDDYYESESGSVDVSIFDKSKEGMGDMAAKRFQSGINVGVGFSYKAIYLGVGYVSDFSKIINCSDKEFGKMVGKIGVTTLTLGINF